MSDDTKDTIKTVFRLTKPPDKVNWSEIDIARASLSPLAQHTEDSEVKLVRYTLPARHKQVELSHLTDTQIGARSFKRDRFLEYRTWLLSRPNRYVTLGGDLIDAATVLSVGSPYENTSAPIDQVDECVDLFMPLAKAGRLLGYVGGNHERRTIKTYGDCGRTIAKELKVPYSRGIQLIDLYYGEHRPFKVSLWHGGGAARTKGAKAQMLHRFMGQADSQLYLVGHLHDALMVVDWRSLRMNGKIKRQKIIGCMSSSFQGYFNSYAEESAMSPSDTMMARVILEPNGHWEVTWK